MRCQVLIDVTLLLDNSMITLFLIYVNNMLIERL